MFSVVWPLTETSFYVLECHVTQLRNLPTSSFRISYNAIFSVFMQFDAHIYVLHTIYVHPHIASCSEGTGIASMGVKQLGIEAYH